MSEKRNIRIVAIGDDLIAGSGDTRALGWIGRVMARTIAVSQDIKIDIFPLAMPNEGTTSLCDRLEKEAMIRFRFNEKYDNRIIIGLGNADIVQNMSLARSRLNLANILDQSTAKNITPIVVGPTPSIDGSMNKKIFEYAKVLSDVAIRRNILYIDMFTPLVNHEQWRTDIISGDGLPDQAGYGLMAWLVLNRGWFRWLGLSEEY